MTAQTLRVRIGQCTHKGRKPQNQDFHAALLADDPALSAKGLVLALADGISSSQVSQVASQTAVTGFLEDYYATPDSWSVKTSAQRVLQALNSWLYAQTRNGPFRYSIERGYVCTFSALILKSATAHLFHIGDARIYRLVDQQAGQCLEPLTEDHRLWESPEKSYLSRALGMRDQLEIDYLTQGLEAGDLFILATDGVYECMDEHFVVQMLEAHADNLDQAAHAIVEHALAQGSDDNLTIQIVRVDQLPPPQIEEWQQAATHLPLPPDPGPRATLDGYTIQRELHGSHRSHVYLALDNQTRQKVVLKIPSTEGGGDAAYRERLLMEEWVARRINHAHVVKAYAPERKRRYLYLVTEYVEGQTLAQWMLDHPTPDLQRVRTILQQVARGLRALHRLEILHQDLRPNNILIDPNGTVKIIDLGAVRVAGVAEADNLQQQPILGTATYTAPEYFIGEPASTRSDQFSLGVIAYQMLSGDLPYGTGVAKAASKTAQRRLNYRPLREVKNQMPLWVDEAIRKSVHINPAQRYAEISELIHDLHKPNPAFLRKERPPLLERNPLAFWRGLSLVLFILILVLLGHTILCIQ